MPFQIKRIYDAPAATDGTRVLVDRLWPRGVSKARAALDDWGKDAAPSSDLRMWFDHRADRLEEFSARYRHELDTDPGKQAAVQKLEVLGKQGMVTLLYAAKDPIVNHALVLRKYLEAHA